MTLPRLSIAIVNYNSGYRLRQCLDAVERNPPSVPYEVVVVDNASADGSADFLEQAPRQRVRLVRSPVNLLFTGGVNLAFLESKGEYFMIMAPDMMPHEGAFDALVRHLDDDATVGGIGAYTVARDGTYDRYVRRFPTPFQVFVGNYFGTQAKRRPILRRFDYGLAEADFDVPVAVDDPMSGCSVVRRSILPSPPLSPEFGLFWSDVELSRIIRAQGLKAMVYPDARFTHDHDAAPRAVKDERSLRLVLDYLVGCHAYFSKYGRKGDGAQVKALFALGALASLALKHLPRAVVGREPWRMIRARWSVLRDFIRDRNRLLEDARRAARTTGLMDRYPGLAL